MAPCNIFGKLEALEPLWSLAKEVELNVDELFLAANEEGKTALQWQHRKTI